MASIAKEGKGCERAEKVLARLCSSSSRESRPLHDSLERTLVLCAKDTPVHLLQGI